MEARQTLTQESKRVGIELAAADMEQTYIRRRLEEKEGGTTDEAEGAKEDKGTDTKGDGEGSEAAKDEESESKDEKGDSAAKESESEDEEEGKKEGEKESESESESKDEEGDKKSASKDEAEGGTKEEEDEKSAIKDKEEAKSDSKDEEGDKKSATKDKEEGAKDEKASESKDEDKAGGKKDEASRDQSAGGDAKEATKTAPLDEDSKSYFESTKDAVLNKPEDEGGESSSDEDLPESPPSFFDMKEYTFDTISFTSCQKIDFAVAYLTSLEFDGSVVKKSKKKQEHSKFWSDVYIAEMVVLPISLMLAFCGSSLLLTASVLAASGFGTFLIFHFVSPVSGGLDCKIKLGLSAVSAGACAALAVKFVRFGLFTLGAFSTGLASYLFFDSFPAFDPGQNFFDAQGLVSDSSYLSSVMKHSDISQAAWAITSVVALFTGICIRVYEQASVEFLTALLGGTGVGYALHAHILVHGGSLNRSAVFVIAFLVGTLGLRFQRRRRLPNLPAKGTGSLPHTWNQLQKSIDTTNAQGDPKQGGKDN